MQQFIKLQEKFTRNSSLIKSCNSFMLVMSILFILFIMLPILSVLTEAKKPTVQERLNNLYFNGPNSQRRPASSTSCRLYMHFRCPDYYINCDVNPDLPGSDDCLYKKKYGLVNATIHLLKSDCIEPAEDCARYYVGGATMIYRKKYLKTHAGWHIACHHKSKGRPGGLSLWERSRRPLFSRATEAFRRVFVEDFIRLPYVGLTTDNYNTENWRNWEKSDFRQRLATEEF